MCRGWSPLLPSLCPRIPATPRLTNYPPIFQWERAAINTFHYLSITDSNLWIDIWFILIAIDSYRNTQLFDTPQSLANWFICDPRDKVGLSVFMWGELR